MVEYFLIVSFLSNPNALISEPLSKQECIQLEKSFKKELKKVPKSDIKNITCQEGSIAESATKKELNI